MNAFIESIAHGIVYPKVEWRELQMDNNAIMYLNAMYQAVAMVKQGIINENDYLNIEQRMAIKYSQNTTSLYRLNDLTNPLFRVINMIPKKE